MVRDDKRRAMLFELDRNIQSLNSRHGESEEALSLLNLYHNLLREWSEIWNPPIFLKIYEEDGRLETDETAAPAASPAPHKKTI